MDIAGIPTTDIFNGLRVYLVPVPPPKIQLSDHVWVGDAFRQEFNQWLLAFFGRQDPILPDGDMVVWEDKAAIFMTHATWLELQKHTTTQHTHGLFPF